jgi:hypothetical protein
VIGRLAAAALAFVAAADAPPPPPATLNAQLAGDLVPTHDRGTDYLAYHAYDREKSGAPTLRIARIRWRADGWPQAED